MSRMTISHQTTSYYSIVLLFIITVHFILLGALSLINTLSLPLRPPLNANSLDKTI